MPDPANITLAIGSEETVLYVAAGLATGLAPFSKDDKQIPYIAVSRAGQTVASRYGSVYSCMLIRLEAHITTSTLSSTQLLYDYPHMNPLFFLHFKCTMQ